MSTLTFFIVYSIIIIGSCQQTIIKINGDNFEINGDITYKSASYDPVRGLLINSRMVQGIFDDYNESTVNNFKYPDTNKWDATRNTNEFIGNTSLWRSNNLLAVTVGLQGIYLLIYLFNM